MRIIAYALYALAGTGLWSGLAYGLRKAWWDVLGLLLVAAMCFFAAGLLLEVWA